MAEHLGIAAQPYEPAEHDIPGELLAERPLTLDAVQSSKNPGSKNSIRYPWLSDELYCVSQADIKESIASSQTGTVFYGTCDLKD